MDHYLVRTHFNELNVTPADLKSHFFRLIVVACLVEVGEVVARLIVHATMSGKGPSTSSAVVASRPPLSREDAFAVLEGIMRKSG